MTLIFDLQRTSEVKFFYTIRKPIHDFPSNVHWHFFSISYRFEIFDFKLFRVWPWPLTFRGHLRSRMSIPFESPYMIPILLPLTLFLYLEPFLRYLTSNILEFDLDLWPLKVIWGQIFFIPFESPYITFYLIFKLTIFLYLLPFLRYLTSNFLEFDLDLWPLEVIWGQNFYTIRKPIHDFLSNCHWHFFSIPYRFWDIWLQTF